MQPRVQPEMADTSNLLSLLLRPGVDVLQRLHARPQLRQREQLFPPLSLRSDHLQLRQRPPAMSACSRSMASDHGWSAYMATPTSYEGGRGEGTHLLDLMSQLQRLSLHAVELLQ